MKTVMHLVFVLSMLLGLTACKAAPEPTPPLTGVEVETMTVATDTPIQAPAATVTSATAAPSDTPATQTPWSADGVVAEGEYAHHQTIDQVTLHWSSDGDTLYMAMQAQATGWVSVGFKPSSRMGGADYVLGFVDDGAVQVVDAWGDAPIGSHPQDVDLGGTDDLGVYGGAEADGVTTIEFSKPLDSGDEFDNALTAGETLDLIVAVGTDDSMAARHSYRGAGAITLD